MKRILQITVLLHVVVGLILIGLGLLRFGNASSRTVDPNESSAFGMDLRGPDWPQYRGGSDQGGWIQGDLKLPLSLLWQFKTARDIVGSAAIQGNRVYTGSADKHIYALSLLDGSMLWTFPTDSAIEASVSLIGGHVVVGSRKGTIYAVDSASGGLGWTFETGGQIAGAANGITGDDVLSSRILVGSYDSLLYCLDAQTGQPLWKYETDNYVNGSAASADGICAFGGCDALVHAVRVTDGNAVQTIDAGAYVASSGAMMDHHFYVGNYEGAFMDVDLNAGEIAWTYFSDGNEPIVTCPAVTDELVVFGARDQQVHCLDRKTGQRRWVFKSLDNVDSSPVIVGDQVVFGSDDGRLYIVSLKDGQKLWSTEIGKAITASPAIAHGRIVVGSLDGTIYCFGRKP